MQRRAGGGVSSKDGLGRPENGGVLPHSPIMHFALSERKRLLRYSARYAACMKTPNERLKIAREAMFGTAVEAAEAMGIPVSTYTGHENGRRGFPAARAPTYARKFGVAEEWLLYGKGDGPIVPSEEQLADMLAEAQSEISVVTPFAGWPRAVAANLREQLLRFQSSGLAPGGDSAALKPAPGKVARSGAPTKKSSRGESRIS